MASVGLANPYHAAPETGDVSMQPEAMNPRWLIWGTATFIWLLAVVLAAQQLLHSSLSKHPTHILYVAAITVFYFVIWGLFIPVIFKLVERWPMVREAFVLRIFLHSTFALGFFFVQGITWLYVIPLFFEEDRSLWVGVFRGFYSNFLFYWCIVGVAHALRYYQELEAERLKRAETQAELVKAQIDVLKMQLNPHFLFNTLHSIAGLMHQDIEAADTTISRLAEMLRMTLSSSYTQMVSFDQEMKLVDLYVGIQKTRFGDRVTFSTEIDEESRQTQVPSLILQPLIENAFVHGVGRNPNPSRILLRSEAKDGHLQIEVTDNSESEVPDDLVLGVGLGNAVNRIRQIYQGTASVDYGARPEGGFRVSIRLPIKHETNRANGSTQSN